MRKNLRRLISGALVYVMAFSVVAASGMGMDATALAFDQTADVFDDPEPQPDPQPDPQPQPMTPFDMPTDPHFITEGQVVRNESGSMSYRAVPGTIIFGTVDGAEEYSINVNNLDTPNNVFFYERSSSDMSPSHIVSYSLLKFMLDSGRYSIFVRAMGNATHSESAEAVSADPWVYNVSPTQLETPTELAWDAGTYRLKWNAVDNAYIYFVDISCDNNGNEEYISEFLVRTEPDEQGKVYFSLPSEVISYLNERNIRNFKYKVTAVPEDIRNSSPCWKSGFSQPFSIPTLPDPYIPASDNSITMMLALPDKPVDVHMEEIKELAITCEPANAAYTDITWESTDTGIATVSAGKVTGIKEGKVKITAKSKKDPEIYAVCEVNILPPLPKVIDQGEAEGLKWILYDDGLLHVEGSPTAKKMSSHNAPWSQYLNKITSLETDIILDKRSRSLFSDMPSLKSATFLKEECISMLRWSMFSGCPLFEEVHLNTTEGSQYSDNGGKMITGPGKKGDAIAVLIGTKSATIIPDGVTQIGQAAYAGKAVPNVIIPASVQSIGLNAFEECDQLTYIVIGNPNIKIENEDDEGDYYDAFEGCSKLTDVYFYGTEEQWEKVAKQSKMLKNATFHKCEGKLELCTVTFVTNGGSEIKPLEVLKGETVGSFPETLKDGCILDGWFMDEALTQPFVEQETKVIGDMTLYAKWREAKHVTVIFYTAKDENGAWVEAARQSVLEDRFVTVPVSQMQAKGDLLGWYSDENYEKVFDPATMRVKGDMSLYAKWSGWTEVTVNAKLGEHVLSYELGYDSETVYDARKHVVGSVNGKGVKGVKATKSVNPDISIEHFVVKLDGEKVTGISINKFKYSNQKAPSYDGKSNKPMYIYPQLKYDSRDEGLKAALQKCSKLKKTLGNMMKPKRNKSTGNWNYEPLDVTIKRIELSKETEIYINSQLASDETLKTKNGILVWKGGTPAYKTKTFKSKNKKHHGDEEEDEGDVTCILKITIPKLYYQCVYEIPGKAPVVKKIYLRPGEWKATKKNDGEGGFYIAMTMKTKDYDYYYDGDSGVELNAEADLSDYMNGNSKRNNKMGLFVGTLPISVERGHGEE